MLNYISNKEEGNKDNRDAIETVLDADGSIDNGGIDDGGIDDGADGERTVSNYATLRPPALILRRN